MIDEGTSVRSEKVVEIAQGAAYLPGLLVVLIGHHSVAFEHQAVRIVDKILRLIRSVTEDIAIDAFAYVRIIP